MPTLRRIFNELKDDKEAAFIFDLDCTLVDTRPLYDQMADNGARLVMEYTDMNYEQAMAAVDSALEDYNGYVREAFEERYNIPGDITVDRVYDPDTMDLSLISVPSYVHDLLDSIQGKVYIYTNSTEKYANAIMDFLGLTDHVDGTFGTDSLDHTRKPAKRSFDLFTQKTDLDPAKTWFFEDSLENLSMARSFGWHTVLTTEFLSGNLHEKERQELSVHVDRIIESLDELLPSIGPQPKARLRL